MNIQRVGVAGCGLMGRGIAEVAAKAGFDVVVSEVDEGAHEADLGLGAVPPRGGLGAEPGLAAAAEADQIGGDHVVPGLDQVRGDGGPGPLVVEETVQHQQGAVRGQVAVVDAGHLDGQAFVAADHDPGRARE